MKGKIHNLFYLGDNYRDEFRKQVRMFITFTLGFTIAFAWRETVFNLSESFVQWISGIKGSNSLSLWASVFITLVGILLIILTARWLKNK